MIKIKELGYSELKTLKYLTEKVIRKKSLGLGLVDELHDILDKCDLEIKRRDKILNLVDPQNLVGKTFRYSGFGSTGCFKVLGIGEKSGDCTDLSIESQSSSISAYLHTSKARLNTVMVIFGDDSDSVTKATPISEEEYGRLKYWEI